MGCGEASHAFFVDEGRIALLHVGTGMEAAVIGPDGLVGHTVLLGGAPMPFQAVANTSARVLRVRRADLLAAMADAQTRAALLSSTIVLIEQLANNIAVANLSVKQRVAHWLLRTAGQTGDTVRVTHEGLSRRLCVRRPGVTVAIHELEGSHLIRNRRGSITVTDRAGLKAVVEQLRLDSSAVGGLNGARDRPPPSAHASN